MTGTRRSNGGRTGLRIGLNTSGTIGALAFYQNPPSPFGEIELADFDLDGDLDVSGTGFANIAIALNNGSGTFTGPFEMIIPSSGVQLAGDFTGDGTLDLIVFNSTNIPMFALYINSTR